MLSWNEYFPEPAVTPSSLFNHTLPVVPAGAGRRALLGYLAEALDGHPEWRPDAAELYRWHGLLEGMANGLKASQEAGAQTEISLTRALHTKVLARWPVWGVDCPWGWEPLFQATLGHHHRQVQKWLDHPGAPDGAALSARLFSFPAVSKRSPPRATLLGAALLKAEAGAKTDAVFATVKALLRAGVDPGQAVDNWGTHAVDASPAAEVSRLLVKEAPVARLPLLFAWLEPKTSLSVVRSKLKEVSALCRSPEGHAMLPALQAAFPDLVNRVAHRLALYVPTEAVGRSAQSEWFQVAKQVRALGRLVGQDCWRPQPDGLSLAGAWARASVMLASDPRYAGTQGRFPAMGSLLINGYWKAWDGQAAGMSSRVWAQLAYPLVPTGVREHPSTVSTTAQDWEALPQAVAAFPVAPHLWGVAMNWTCLDPGLNPDPLVAVKKSMADDALGVLVPDVWPCPFNEEKRRALISETSAHKKTLREALLRMGRLIGARVMADQEENAPQEVEKALGFYVLSGLQDPQGVKRLLGWCESRAVAVDTERLRAVMESPHASVLLTDLAPAKREALLSLLLGPAIPAGPKPRF